MEYKSEKPSCLECIWCDQCASDEICDFFDPGRLSTDEEIELEIEIQRNQYRLGFQKYIDEYGDGRNDQ